MLNKQEQTIFLKVFIRLIKALKKKDLSTRETKLIQKAEGLLEDKDQNERI